MTTKNSDFSKKFGPIKIHPYGLRTVMELFDVGPAIAITVLSSAVIIFLFAIGYFIHSAPPSTLVISSGPTGSILEKNAAKYARTLEKNGVKVTVLASQGSFENLQRLVTEQADIGIVQAGITQPGIENLVSLGSISYQPLLVFYRGDKIELLSQLAGKRVAVGHTGSGTRNFALALLNANGIKEGSSTTLINWDAEQASKGLTENQIDAAFIMSESASIDILHALMRSKDIHLFNYKQANAYSRKIDYLNLLELPEGSIDLGLNIPKQDVQLLGPMVELIAKKDLHPALSDLILEAATIVHNRPGLFQRRGDFPTPIEHIIRVSDDAYRFYKSGKSLLYRFLPFWLASLVSRIIVVFIPTLVIVIPMVRSIPAFFRWRTQIKIRRRYRELLTVEQDFLSEKDPAKLTDLRHHFDRIEEAVNKMNIRAAFADQFYGLRGHIDYVRELVTKKRI